MLLGRALWFQHCVVERLFAENIRGAQTALERSAKILEAFDSKVQCFSFGVGGLQCDYQLRSGDTQNRGQLN